MVQWMTYSMFDRHLQLCVLFGVCVFASLMDAMPCAAAAIHMICRQGYRRVDGICRQNVLIASLGVAAITLHHFELWGTVRWFDPGCTGSRLWQNYLCALKTRKECSYLSD